MIGLSYRVRPELRFSPARAGDEVYYVVEDRTKHRFWKIGLLEYEVCAAMDGTQSMQETATLVAQRSKLGAATAPEKLMGIGSWLLNIGIIEAVGNELKAENGEPPKPQPNAAKPMRMFDPSFFRIPIMSAESLDRLTSGLTWLVSFPCLAVAAIIWLVAVVTAYQNSVELMALGRKLFVPGSQWWLLVAWLVLKVVHEAGHAIANTRVGSKSNGAGIGFIFFAPSPYVDVTGLWCVPNRWSRVLVSASGMLFEITLAAVAVICACTLENSTLKFLCFTIASLGTFTTVAFNGNPLMRYDGYYILIDLIDRPNLFQDAAQSMKAYFLNWIQKGGNGYSCSIPLVIYGVSCSISRMLLLVTMGWGMWMTWDGAGLVVVGFFVCLWFVVPKVKRMLVAAKTAPLSIRTFFSSVCPAKAARCFAILGALSLCSFLPSPFQIYWPAIVEYVEPSDVRTGAPGFVVQVFVHDGQGLQSGDEILRLSNPDLELECKAAQAMLQASEEKCVALRAQHKHTELQTEEALRESLLVKANSLIAKVESLRLKSPRDGVLIARLSRNLAGSFIPEGQSIGMVVNPAKIEVNASIPQYAWESIAHHVDAPVSITMSNGDHWTGKLWKTLPRTSDSLDSPSLGGIYGGPITVVQSTAPNGEPLLKTDTPRLHTRIEVLEPARVSKLISLSREILPPPPGAHCSVKLQMENEAVWQTGYRWLKASLQTQFKEAK